jgi:hypothetical protein
VPVFDFPNWTVYVDGKEYPHGHEYDLGRISIKLSPGEYKVEGVFKNTWVRLIADLLTLTSLFISVLIIRNKRIAGKIL